MVNGLWSMVKYSGVFILLFPPDLLLYVIWFGAKILNYQSEKIKYVYSWTILLLTYKQLYRCAKHNEANLFCFLSSLPLLPRLPWQCLGPTCHLSTLNWYCFACAGLPVHMLGEVSWNPKRRRVYSILSGKPYFISCFMYVDLGGPVLLLYI